MRCDRCNQAAKAVAYTQHGRLYFCGHHANALLSSIIEAGIVIDPIEKELVSL